jgi:hypothetical protein
MAQRSGAAQGHGLSNAAAQAGSQRVHSAAVATNSCEQWLAQSLASGSGARDDCAAGPPGGAGPLHVAPVPSGSAQAKLFQFLLHRYHYLGHRNCVGENLKYLACDRGGRPLACVLFGSAAWKCQARDAYIGWSAAQRQRHLRLLTNNTRLLVLPWVRVPDLASHLLGHIALRLSQDWQAKYGHPIHLLESFVQADRFLGRCYQAAGWIALGATTGRGRNAPSPAPQGPVKQIYVRALSSDWAQRLCA